MEKSHVSGVAKDKDVARLALVALENRPGVAFKVFSLLANAKINVDIILQSIGRDESKDISFTVVRKDVDAARALLEEHKDALGFQAIEVNDQIAKVSIVGAGMIGNPRRGRQHVRGPVRCRHQHQHDLHQRNQGLRSGG